MKKSRKSKIDHGFYEEKNEFGGTKSESLCFKGDTPTMLGPYNAIK